MVRRSKAMKIVLADDGSGLLPGRKIQEKPAIAPNTINK